MLVPLREPPITLHRWTRAAMYDTNASGNIRLPPPIGIAGRWSPACSSGPRASRPLMIMSGRDAAVRKNKTHVGMDFTGSPARRRRSAGDWRRGRNE